MDLVRRARPTVNLVAEPPDGGLNAALRAARDAAIGTRRDGDPDPARRPAAARRRRARRDARLRPTPRSPPAVAGPSSRSPPRTRARGTNALLLSPPDVIEPQFGDASLEAHLRAAAEADASVQLVIDPALGFDLDTPDDLERLDLGRMLELEQLGQRCSSPSRSSRALSRGGAV